MRGGSTYSDSAGAVFGGSPTNRDRSGVALERTFFFVTKKPGGITMDGGKIFVLILAAVAIGILAFIELKSRRSRKD
jgi:hypothetical protein